jgi:hypothetical protein
MASMGDMPNIAGDKMSVGAGHQEQGVKGTSVTYGFLLDMDLIVSYGDLAPQGFDV